MGWIAYLRRLQGFWGGLQITMCKLFRQIATTDALYASQVSPALRRMETVNAQQASHCFGLVMAMFQQKTATMYEMRTSSADQASCIIKSMRARDLCCDGLKSDITAREMGVILGNIGWVADDKVKVSTLKYRKPVAAHEVDSRAE